ncbi:hypothetical protein ACIOMP_28595 [Pseudomonas protegens]|uniref:hypothetical protein n=1 Tax=Pseudomonas protegens TaxID=380021 RepID=UPI0021C71EC5|nr:hypothetical protein [Pseudomonas protegens]MCU1769694.1 hypothetical protein [Pseudomonas protegens]
MSDNLSKDKIIELLKEISDLEVRVDKSKSSDLEGVGSDNNNETLLTREDLEKLVEKQDNINVYAFHSSGINNIGNHSSN